jgi:quinol-cytochrome oxidoreductase complex cytochrome b subunit
MLGFVLVGQIVTGLFLVIFYTCESFIAFERVEYIMREVNSGWFLRAIHFNGASLFFVCLYLHIGRGLVINR